MGIATVLNCDKCKHWDSEENPVRTVTVGGPRFELCRNHRVALIHSMGVDEIRARAYVLAYDLRGLTRGQGLALDGDLVNAQLAKLMAGELGTSEEVDTSSEDVGEASTGGPDPVALELVKNALVDAPGDATQPPDEGDAYANQVLADLSEEDHTEDDADMPAVPARAGGRRRK